LKFSNIPLRSIITKNNKWVKEEITKELSEFLELYNKNKTLQNCGMQLTLRLDGNLSIKCPYQERKAESQRFKHLSQEITERMVVIMW